MEQQHKHDCFSSAMPACHWLQHDPITSGVTSVPGIWRPLWLLYELPGVTEGGLCPVSGGTKQYERFRDTIFLNYWAIVFVQDVVF